MLQFDRWIYQAFSSVPEYPQVIILIACSIYVKFPSQPPDEFFMLKSLVSHVWLELGLTSLYPDLNFKSKLFAFILPRLPTVFCPNFHLTGSHYTKFALWCTKCMSEEFQ